MFESIGKLESAASCFCDLGDYERAGKIYLYKCGKTDAAAECFTLAGCYSDAAEAYAKGDQYSTCLSVCKKGKLFDQGLQYIEYWKEHVYGQSKELEQIEQKFLESCALDYHERKDHKSMLKFVRAFSNMESKRAFLRSKDCLDDLLVLEEESGHFLDAAELARSWGDVLKEADLMEKAGSFVIATDLLLWYVLFSSLWGNGNRGWPLKQFARKEELCEKAKSLAILDSEKFSAFVIIELTVLSDKHSSLADLKKHLQTSKKHESLRGEILSIRKILDSHFRVNSSKYDWEDRLPIDITTHCEDKIFQNQVSVRTLIFYWNLWKEHIVNIFQSIKRVEIDEPNKHEGHFDFCLNHFGVRKLCLNGKTVYMLVNKDADWIRSINQKALHRDGKLLAVEIKDLVFVIRSYWQSELLSVGIKVLETLEVLHKLSLKRSLFHQSTSVLHIFEVSKFLVDCQYLNVTFHYKKMLQNFLEISTTYFDIVFPLDWRRSVSEDLLSLRETDLSVNLLDEIIRQDVDIKGDLTYWKIGRLMMICLSSRKPSSLYQHIIAGLQWNPLWKSFVEKLWNSGLIDVYVTQALQNALEDTYRANWRLPGYMSPQSFVYLLDCLIFMASLSCGVFFSIRSSFVEWFTHVHSATTLSAVKQIFSKPLLGFILEAVQQFLYNKADTKSWIRASNIDLSYHQILALKLVIILSLVCLQASNCSRTLHDLLLGRNSIASLLPNKFVHNLLRRRKGQNLNLNPEVVAEAFVSIEDPLLIVSSVGVNKNVDAPCAIFVDLGKSKEEIMSVLFPQKDTQNDQTCSNTLRDANLNVNLEDGCKGERQMNWKVLEDISDTMDGKTGVALNSLHVAPTIKKELDKNMFTLASALADENFCAGKDTTFVHVANRGIDELRLAFSPPDTSGQKAEHSVNMEIMQRIVERLKSSRPKIDDFLNQFFTSQDSKVVEMKGSNTTAAHADETCKERKNDDNLPAEVVLENQNRNDGTNKKGKGTNKGSKNRKKSKRK